MLGFTAADAVNAVDVLWLDYRSGGDDIHP